MNYNDEFYDEPTEFEKQIDEFKQSLILAVKTDYQKKMERLQKENSELQEFKLRKNELEQEHSRSLREMKYQIEQAERKFKNARLSTLLGEYLTVGWGLERIYTKSEKCDKCDDIRKIHFVSPSGKDVTEQCSCDKTTTLLKPQELELIRFYVQQKGWDDHTERHFRKLRGIDSDYDEYQNTTNIYKEDVPFEKINSYGIVFLKKEDCQKYCDWKNNQKSEGE